MTESSSETTLTSDMVLKEFLNDCSVCPMCRSAYALDMSVVSGGGRDDENISGSVEVAEDRLNITISTKYFIGSQADDITFSITINGGMVICCNTASQFISIYDIDILLRKSCKQCHVSKIVKLFYDRADSVFTVNRYFEIFSVLDGKKRYSYYNNYYDRKSYICTTDFSGSEVVRTNEIETPFIPFDDFAFDDKKKLISKLQSILILS